jgi:arginyl-tRNA synthetase
MNILQHIQTALAPALEPFGAAAGAAAEQVRPAQNPQHGDYQINCAMSLAKSVGAKPRDVAGQIVGRLNLAPMVEKVDVAGPGFINLRLATDWLAAQVRELAGDERLGVVPVVRPRTVVIDYSSPNVAKPMHVGHIRSTIIGDALARLLRFLGHRVITDNHVGDWGTQFGMIILGYKRHGNPRAMAEDPIHELLRLYLLINGQCKPAEWAEALDKIQRLHGRGPDAEREAGRRLEELGREAKVVDEQALASDRTAALARIEFDLQRRVAEGKAAAEAARLETAKLHAGDPENRSLWQTFMPHCLAAMQPIYGRLDVAFDHVLGESFYDPMLPGIVDDLLGRGLAQESEGAVCIFRAGVEAPCIVRKRDGAYTYATTDLATIRYRAETFHPDVVLYVVDQRQGEHFKQLFDAAQRWGYDGIEFQHVAFGTIMGNDSRPFRTREGGTVGLEPLLDEAVERARRIVDENSPQLDEAARQAVAEAVGIGALKYADLSQNRTSDYVFSWDKMIAMQGNTATYLQYAYARVQSIFRTGGLDAAVLRRNPPTVTLGSTAERALAVLLIRLPEVLDQAAGDYRPNLITAHLYELAEAFSTFYNTCPVLKAESPAVRDSRLLLCDLTARTLRLGLGLLGIRTIDQM